MAGFRRLGFTLVELLVVIALLPREAFFRAKRGDVFSLSRALMNAM